MTEYDESTDFMHGLMIGLTVSALFIGAVVLIVVAFLL